MKRYRSRLVKRILPSILVHGLLAMIVVVIVYPFLWMITASLRPTVQDIWSTDLVKAVIPERISLTFYRNLISLGAGRFFLWTKNSLIFTLGSTAVNIAFCSMAGYALASRDLPGRGILLVFFLAMMVIPSSLVIIPMFLVVNSLKMLNTYPGVFLPMAAEAFSVLVLYRFFSELPHEILEAARMDGAHEWGVLWRIALPLARPAIGAVLLRQFIVGWNAFTLPLVLGQDARLRNLQVAMTYFNNLISVDFGSIMAVGSTITLPVLIVFMFTSRTLIRGITAGALKG